MGRVITSLRVEDWNQAIVELYLDGLKNFKNRVDFYNNEIDTAILEMGKSITEQEKRQVLIEILEKLC